jgi:hypothetical protein
MGPVQPWRPRPALPVRHRHHRAPAPRGTGPARHLLPERPARRRPADRRQDRGRRDRPAGVPLGPAGAAAARSRRQGAAPDRGGLEHPGRLQPGQRGFPHLLSAAERARPGRVFSAAERARPGRGHRVLAAGPAAFAGDGHRARGARRAHRADGAPLIASSRPHDTGPMPPRCLTTQPGAAWTRCRSGLVTLDHIEVPSHGAARGFDVPVDQERAGPLRGRAPVAVTDLVMLRSGRWRSASGFRER